MQGLWCTNLEANREQLHRYFLTLDSCIGILTDGIRYLFFSSADDGKNMDSTPFMELRLDNIDSSLVPELRRFRKGHFDLKSALDAISELKFNRQVKLALTNNLTAPDMDFVDYMVAKVGLKRVRAKNKEERYVGYVHRAFKEFIDDQVDSRLKVALSASSKKEVSVVEQKQAEPITVLGNVQGNGIETTLQEVEGFYIVRAILSSIVDPKKVVLRDTTNYAGVLFEDNRRKPICRLYFNDVNNLQIELFDGDKKTKHQLEEICGIHAHAEALRAVVESYLKPKVKESPTT